MSGKLNDMVNGRQKGASFERTICNALQDDLNVKTAKRDFEQYRSADRGDILIDDNSFPYTIECKRYKKGSWSQSWWDQVEKAAEAADKEPVLVYKFDRQPIRVVMRLEHLMKDKTEQGLKVELDWDAFCYVARENWNS